MRTFSCFVTEVGSTTPILSLILADTPERARDLAYRELRDSRQPVSVELCENGELLWMEHFEGIHSSEATRRGNRSNGARSGWTRRKTHEGLATA
jgi:hypothetical protein